MRFYAEWLDGEYTSFESAMPGYRHWPVMQRGLKLQALFGNELALSDVQSVDPKNPLPESFLDPSFRGFLADRPTFLTLTAAPVKDLDANQEFLIAFQGINRVSQQSKKPPDSYEQALTEIGALLVSRQGIASSFVPTSVGDLGLVELLNKFSRHRAGLLGTLTALHHFAHPSGTGITNLRSGGNPLTYDAVLDDMAKNRSAMLSDFQRERVVSILGLREQLPEFDRSNRAALRKLLAPGEWQNEIWSEEGLLMYLDAVHAWNHAIRMSVSPDAGSLFESNGSVPIASVYGTVTDRLVVGGEMSEDLWRALPDELRKLMMIDPGELSWDTIRGVVDATSKSESLQEYQLSLSNPDLKVRLEAIRKHAAHLAESLVDIRQVRLPVWGWYLVDIAVGGAAVLLEEESVITFSDVALTSGPFVAANLRRFFVTSSINYHAKQLV